MTNEYRPLDGYGLRRSQWHVGQHQSVLFKLFIYLCLGFVLLVMSIVVPLSNFADYPGYLQLSDDLATGYRPFRWWFEPISTGMIILSGVMIPDRQLSIDLLYRITEVLFFPAFIFVTVRYRPSTIGMLFAFAMSAPLLMFVTLRATPAYLLVWLATVQAREGKLRCVVTCLCGALFHFSATLALVPLLLCVVEQRLADDRRAKAVRWWITLILAGGAAALFIVRQHLNLFILDFVMQRLDTYASYVNGLDPMAVASGGLGESHLSHTIYLAGVAALVVMFCLQKQDNCARLRNLVVSSFIIFLLLEFSPVTAFRYSTFWIVPVLLAMPWNRIAPHPFFKFGLSLASAALFLYESYLCLDVMSRPDLSRFF